MKPKSPIFPESILVKFRGRLCNSDDPTFTFNNFYTSQILLADTDFALADDGEYNGFVGEVTFHDTAIATFTTSSPTVPTNQTVLDDLSLQIAKDYYYYKNYIFDITYGGIYNILPNSIVDEIIIDYDADCVKTRIHTQNYIGNDCEQLSHWDEDSDLCTNKQVPYEEFYGPPGSCEDGHIKLTVYRVGIENGRLVKYYDRQETI